MAAIQQVLKQGRHHHQTGRHAEAERCYRDVLRAVPRHGEALQLLGVLLLQQGRYNESVPVLTQATDVTPQLAAGYCNLGTALRGLDQTTQAIASFRAALALDGTYAGAHHNLALALQDDDQLQAAYHHFHQALQIQPNHEPALTGLGNVCLQSDNTEEAIRCFEQVVQQSPESPRAHYHLANSLTKSGRLSESIVALKRARDLAPECPETHNNLGLLFQECEDLELARASFEAALSCQPEHPQAMANLGDLLLRQHHFQEACEILERALVHLPDNANLMCSLGRALACCGEREDADSFFREAHRHDPKLARAIFGIASGHAHRGEQRDACTQYQLGVELDPTNLDALRCLANLQNDLNDRTGSIATYHSILERDNTDTASHISLARLHSTGGDFPIAIRHLKQALLLEPENWTAWDILGFSWLGHGNPIRAISCYRTMLKLRPGDTSTRSNLADLYRLLGRLDDARCLLDALIGDNDNSPLKIVRASLLPAIYDSTEQQRKLRERLASSLDDLYSEGYRLDPAQAPVHPLFYLPYHGVHDRGLFEQRSRIFESSYRPPRNMSCGRHADGRIHVGFVSQNFKDHTIGVLMYGLISRLCRERFHVSVLSSFPNNDTFGARIRADADDTLLLTDDVPTAMQTIEQAQFDVLFYSDLGMDAFTYALAHSRLAPVQCTTWGHPVTTGLNTVDYFLSSELLELAEADDHYTERLMRLSTLPTYYVRPILPERMKSRSELGLPADRHLYVCPQSLFKLHPDFDRIMGDILRRDPHGIIVLIAGLYPMWERQLRHRLQLQLPDCHQRILIIPRMDAIDFQHLLGCADVMLDPLHFSGGNTSYQAFALGLPIVSLPGRFMRSRVTAAQCQLLGADSLIVDTPEAYVQQAVAVATNGDYRATLSSHILAHNEALFENQEAVTEIERFLEHAVEWHAAHQGVRPPRGFRGDALPRVRDTASRAEPEAHPLP